LNTSQELGYTKRMEKFCTKMKTSGHSQKVMREVLIAGVTSYERKLTWNSIPHGEPGQRPLYKTGISNIKVWQEKSLNKNNWFIEKNRAEMIGKQPVANKNSKSKKTYQRDGLIIKSSTVFFVPKHHGMCLTEETQRKRR
jgi:hypothetical protein